MIYFFIIKIQKHSLKPSGSYFFPSSCMHVVTECVTFYEDSFSFANIFWVNILLWLTCMNLCDFFPFCKLKSRKQVKNNAVLFVGFTVAYSVVITVPQVRFLFMNIHLFLSDEYSLPQVMQGNRLFVRERLVRRKAEGLFHANQGYSPLTGDNFQSLNGSFGMVKNDKGIIQSV